jgi:anti-sigma regulatory factor (Ser/Thr protein kinase)
MIELALHVLDIAQNSTRAGARVVTITVEEDTERDLLSLAIADDGRGMDEAELTRALDPFYTTKKVRRVGLGLPMLREAAERTGGALGIESSVGSGTRVVATFGLSHVDRQPLGDMALTMISLIAGDPETDFVYTHRRDAQEFRFDTRDVKRELEDVPIHHTQVLTLIRSDIVDRITELGKSA